MKHATVNSLRGMIGVLIPLSTSTAVGSIVLGERQEEPLRIEIDYEKAAALGWGPAKDSVEQIRESAIAACLRRMQRALPETRVVLTGHGEGVSLQMISEPPSPEARNRMRNALESVGVMELFVCPSDAVMTELNLWEDKSTLSEWQRDGRNSRKIFNLTLDEPHSLMRYAFADADIKAEADVLTPSRLSDFFGSRDIAKVDVTLDDLGFPMLELVLKEDRKADIAELLQRFRGSGLAVVFQDKIIASPMLDEKVVMADTVRVRLGWKNQDPNAIAEFIMEGKGPLAVASE
jgi:hypothetical protein